MDRNTPRTNSITLTASQQRAFNMLRDFVNDEASKVFILDGYAGTGKTTLVRSLIGFLNEEGKGYSLLASTGRAAQVLSRSVDDETLYRKVWTPHGEEWLKPTATTIHSCIYRYDDFNHDLDKMARKMEAKKEIDDSDLLILIFNPMVVSDSQTTSIYIVDEASMVGDEEQKNVTQAKFGTGKLLTELFGYDSRGKFIFVGDDCQLPPVMQSQSPALSAEYIQQTFGYQVVHAQLTEIVRQAADNDIIRAAARIRQLVLSPPCVKWAELPLRHYQHIHVHANQWDMLLHYIHSVKDGHYDKATLITRSNNMCKKLTSIIRPSLGFHDDRLMEGELILITQNNIPTGLTNGDQLRVVSVGGRIKRAGLTFLRVELENIFSQQRYEHLLIEDLLYANAINLDGPAQTALFMDYYYRMKEKGVAYKSAEFTDGLYSDPYLNALRAVYGYALTCHKSQGGEWEEVYLDIPRRLPLYAGRDVYQWLYTAVTRARNMLHVVDDFFIK